MYKPDVRDVVELSHDVMPDFGTSEPVRLVDLGTEMAKNDDGRLVLP